MCSARAVVLVIEDEPLLRLHAVEVIEEAGFDVVEAGSAADATEILTKRSDVRIVFTDISLPGSMDGLKLAILIRDRWPPIEIIITSGQSNPRTEDMPLRSRFFAKPYDARELVSALRSFAP